MATDTTISESTDPGLLHCTQEQGKSIRSFNLESLHSLPQIHPRMRLSIRLPFQHEQGNKIWPERSLNCVCPFLLVRAPDATRPCLEDFPRKRVTHSVLRFQIRRQGYQKPSLNQSFPVCLLALLTSALGMACSWRPIRGLALFVMALLCAMKGAGGKKPSPEEQQSRLDIKKMRAHEDHMQVHAPPCHL